MDWANFLCLNMGVRFFVSIVCLLWFCLVCCFVVCYIRFSRIASVSTWVNV